MSANDIHEINASNGAADPRKPTYTQLREEGLSEQAIQTLMLGRDAMVIMTPDETATFLALSNRAHPLDVEEVWPDGVPEHWQDWSNYDPTDDALAIDWQAEGWSERNERVMRLVRDIASGAA